MQLKSLHIKHFSACS